MIMFNHYSAPPRSARTPGTRRGNTMILVAGILALLVVIATAFVTRTQGSRITGVAVQKDDRRTNNAENIAQMLADEVAQALFTYPVDITLDNWIPADSNIPRLRPFPDAERYAPDPGLFPYNRAPYQVFPFTNWPDSNGLDPAVGGLLPHGPGNPLSPSATPLGFTIQQWLYNPAGNPGFGDTRWLANTEPARWRTGFSASFHDDLQQDAYAHWPHMTNIARANNNFRVITDISDYGDLSGDGLGLIINDLRIPVEQFPISDPSFYSSFTGDAVLVADSAAPDAAAINGFEGIMRDWFGVGSGLTQHLFAYGPGGVIPPNRFPLADLDGDGIRNEPGERPQDAFAGPGSDWPNGSPRWNVERIFADADGDGFTDSLWFIVPTPTANGEMQVIAVRIIDNSAMLNVNAATRASSTPGETPADLSLVGSNSTHGPSAYNSGVYDWNNFDVGLLDFPLNWYRNGNEGFAYASGQWANRFAKQIGFTYGANEDTPPGLFNGDPIFAPTRYDKLDFYNRAARRLTDPEAMGIRFTHFPNRTYKPFTFEDELELRMYHGNNYNWNFSRLEQALQPWQLQNGSGEDIVRASISRNETAQMSGDPKDSRMLLRDLRSKMTVYNAARNDLMPPYLWDEGPPQAISLGFVQPVSFDAADTSVLQRRKFDLRSTQASAPVGSPAIDESRELATSFRFDVDTTPLVRRRLYLEDLREVIYRALTEFDQTGSPRSAYITGYDPATGAALPPDGGQVQEAARQAAHFASNIDTYRTTDERVDDAPATWYADTVPYPARDGTDPAFLSDAIPVRDVTGTGIPGATTPQAVALGTGVEAAVGLSPQPFLVEAFIAHVHSSQLLPPKPTQGDEDPVHYFQELGVESYVDTSHEQTTITVVQIANPFDEPIDLRDYVIKVFGDKSTDAQELDLGTDISWNLATGEHLLKPGTVWYPRTATFACISTEFAHSHEQVNLGSSSTPGGGNTFDALWLDYLDIGPFMVHQIAANDFDDDGNTNTYNPQSPNSGNIFRNVYQPGTLAANQIWSTDRETYDNMAAEEQIQLIRKDYSLGTGTPVKFVVDRFDPAGTPAIEKINDSFALFKLMEPPVPYIDDDVINGILLPDGQDTLVQWARVTRAWGHDNDLDPQTVPPFVSTAERNPRYVFSIQSVTHSRDANGRLLNKYEHGGTELTVGKFGTYLAMLDQPPDDDGPGGGVDAWPLKRSYSNAYGQSFVEKLTFFDMQGRFQAALGGVADTPYADKGFYGLEDGVKDRLNFPMQMLVKNGDFQQLGELLNVWMYGHSVEVALSAGAVSGYIQTHRTFSEHMANELNRYEHLDRLDLAVTPEQRAANSYGKTRINRLRVEPFVTENNQVISPVAGLSDPVIVYGSPDYYAQPALGIPNIPIGARIFDAFVLDGAGVNDAHFDESIFFSGLDPNVMGVGWIVEQPFNLAGGFRGEITPGLVNLSTAPLEVLRTIPHWTKLVHDNGAGDAWQYPFTQIAESVVQYRQHYDGDNGFSDADPVRDLIERIPGAPNFGTGFTDDVIKPWDPLTPIRNPLRELHREPGFKSIAELMLLTQSSPAASEPLSPLFELPGYTMPIGSQQSASDQVIAVPNDAWRIDFTAAQPYLAVANSSLMSGAPGLWQGSWLSTDVVGPNLSAFQPSLPLQQQHPSGDPGGYGASGDGVSGDVEEANLLFAGASNLVTTRSDVFTVYFKVRTFRQNLQTGVWDATDPEHIVDDSRYVMMVDRSNVNHPVDKPRILYFEELPY